MVCDPQGQPLILVECKAPEVPIDQKVLDQVCRYNTAIQSPYLMVTNGMKHYSIAFKDQAYSFMNAPPAYTDAVAETQES